MSIILSVLLLLQATTQAASQPTTAATTQATATAQPPQPPPIVVNVPPSTINIPPPTVISQPQTSVTWVAILGVCLSAVALVISGTALKVAYRNFRLSRFPHIDVKLTVHWQHRGTQTDVFFDVEVLSNGLAIYDMKMILEGRYEGDECAVRRYEVYLEHEGTLPNPINAGQYCKFFTSQAFIQGVDTDPNCHLNRKLGFSDLPPENVTLTIYGSGGKVIKRMTAKEFPLGFDKFDTLKPQPEATPKEMEAAVAETFEIDSVYTRRKKDKYRVFTDA